ncbi:MULTISPECIES: exosortase-associated protein EpsI, B-type [unclassified Duganella]|uniref:exosortase-associated protein EpsI, B-type n=1 Tax=unclassified Duganella TaxID=2636909 RepID=UPI0008911066|nr:MULTISPECIES: exosortase-associated protein EpsI, B-type [unclassified Duganella]SDH35968.1 EpsI family protein [Duganella sp. OV458]SDK52358.1 EpsI family protein [Duganella sp. OV510]
MTVWRRNLVLMVLMVLASGLAAAWRPTEKLVTGRPPVSLSALVPASFGEWREEPQTVAMVVDPQQQATIDKIYQQTLSRTYINRDGERIMLSLAYGDDQRDSMQLHYPEVCYPAQGFQLRSNERGVLDTGAGVIPVRRLMATLAGRSEPVTYWTLIGEHAVMGGTSTKLAQIRYGLHGKIPDGLLFRVSSFNADPAAGHALQERYVRSMVAALSPEARVKLIGATFQ